MWTESCYLAKMRVTLLADTVVEGEGACTLAFVMPPTQKVYLGSWVLASYRGPDEKPWALD